MAQEADTRTMHRTRHARGRPRSHALIIEEPGGPLRVVGLARGRTVVGTGEGCTLRLHARYLSRRHCVLEPRGGLVHVEDLGSRNGTEVDGRPVSRSILAPGSLLQLGDASATLVEAVEQGFLFESIVAAAASSLRLIHGLNRVAASPVPVLVLGPSGGGKELVARALHRRSGRAEGPLVVLNCGALPETLAEAELFGARRGSYTGADHDRPGAFARADGGTLFLDEVGELPPSVQPKLLRALEQGEIQSLGAPSPRRVSVRVVAATNQPVEDPSLHPGFRRDLLYRLAGCRLRVEPLAERPEDIAPIAIHALRSDGGRSASPEALAWLGARRWPGNVRELLHLLRVASALTRHDPLEPEDLARAASEEVSAPREAPAPGLGPLDRLIVESLARHRGELRATLDSLRMPRSTFYARLRRLRAEGHVLASP